MYCRNKNKKGTVKSAESFVVFLFLVSFAHPAFPQINPYIEDAVATDNLREPRPDDMSVSIPQLLCTFKLFNPDTVPFYMWISFKNRGKLRHVKYGEEFPGLRLAELELRYKNDLSQPIVKKISNNSADNRVKKRFGGAWLGGGRSRKKMSREEFAEEDVENTIDNGSRMGRASEIAFWKEDAQGYYEMELWGVLYGSDLNGGVVAGRYIESVHFDIEAMSLTQKK
jgi:hypothetical protein